MGELLVLGLVVLLVLPLSAFLYAQAARRRVDEVAAELESLRERQRQLAMLVGALRRERLGGDSGLPIEDSLALAQVSAAPLAGPPVVPAPPALTAPPTAAPPLWPEDQGRPAARTRTPRGPSVWGPEFGQARISLVGSLLVLGGLAFTLRALGAPAWTMLLVVFTFGGVLYGTARLVPWPVSGALRGLGYGVAALGLGSAAQRLPDAWGPGAVLLGLLGLSAALVWDSLRRRELLLGTLAVGGAALSTWMLTDDLGWASIPAAGAALLLCAVAVWPVRVPGVPEASEPSIPGTQGASQPTSHSAARTLTLLTGAAVPVGWLVAALSHENSTPLWSWLDAALKVNSPLGLWPWLAFTLLAVTVPVALRRLPASADAAPDTAPTPTHEQLAAASAVLLPLALVALAVGAALRDALPLSLTAALGLGLGLIPAALALPGWRARRRAGLTALAQPDPAHPDLRGTVTSSLTAASTGVLSAAALALLGGGAQWTALSAIGAALLSLGLAGHSRLWGRAGAGLLALTALYAAGPAANVLSEAAPSWRPGWLSAALLTAPALVAVLGALQLGRSAWWGHARPLPPLPEGFHPATSPAPLPRLSGPVLGLTGAAAGALTLAALDPALLAAWCALAAGAALALRSRRAGEVAFWAFTPVAAAGGLWLLSGDREGQVALGMVVTLLAAVTVQSRVQTGPPRSPAWAWAVPALLAVTLGRAASLWWPALGVPGGLALAALLAAALPSPLGGRRLDALLGAGLLSGLLWLAQEARPAGTAPVLGGGLLLLVWGALRTRTGLARLRRWTQSVDAPRPPEQVVWSASLLALTLTLVGAALTTGQGTWWLLASGAAMAVGLWACGLGRRTAHRAVWDAGLAVVIAAGLKAALLDAQWLRDPAPVVGLAALGTGLALLGVAVFAPRPAGRSEEARAETAPGQASGDSGP